jgi:hypothetical protein
VVVATKTDEGTLSDPTPPGPAPSNWIRVQRKGPLSFNSAPALPVPVGFLEAAGFATNFDVIIDWSSAVYPADVYVVAAITVQQLPGTGRKQLGIFHLSPTGGVSFSDVYVPGSTYCVQPEGIGGQQFLLHGGGVAGLVWGLELALVGFTFGEEISQLVCTGIAHGREL